jgi:hypothetical protein
MQSAEKPEPEKDEQYQAQSASEPRSTNQAIAVKAVAAAEQQDDHHDDQDCSHPSPHIADIRWCRRPNRIGCGIWGSAAACRDAILPLLTTALNDLKQNHYNRDDQEDVDDAAHRVRGDETQKPEDD